jgi:DNA-binding CsgD family transcriptional regulator
MKHENTTALPWISLSPIPSGRIINITKEERPRISSRELEVLHLIAHEFSTKEIAAKLYISTHTVISHRKNLMMKLDVKNTAGLVRVGFERGIIGNIKS